MARTTTNNFIPLESKTIAFVASATSANVQFTTTVNDNTGIARLPTSLEIANGMTVACFVSWGLDNTTTATAGSYYCGPGVDKIIDLGSTTPAWVAVFPISSTTGSVYLTRGIGS